VHVHTALFRRHLLGLSALIVGVSIDSRTANPENITYLGWSPRISLKGYPRSVQLEYRVKAINKTGQSPPSNTIAVIL